MITERGMARTLHRLFQEYADVPEADRRFETWPDPWRTIGLIAERIDNSGYGDALRSAHAGVLSAALRNYDDSQADELMARIIAAAEPVHFPTLAEIAENLPPVTWLWEKWIPRGMLSLLGAWPGTGKSYFALDLARTTIHGGAWPDGSPVDATGPVVYCEAEAIPQVTNQRAVQLGLDRRQLYLVMAEDGKLLDLTQVSWQDHLVDLVGAVRPRLLIVDSLTSVSSIGQNSVEETNMLLMFLVALARYGDCGLLCIHHLRKPGTGQLALPGVTIHDFRGSSHIVAMARTILGLSVIQSGKAFSLNGPRRLDQVKSNLGPYGDPLGLILHDDGQTARFEYGPAPTWESGDSSADTCELWLLAFLKSNGPSRPADVVAAGEEKGYSRRTIYRARKALGDSITNTKGRQNRENHWALPGDDTDEDPDEEPQDDEG